jgi:MFS superfamily sulfate permease-like transporter
LNTLLGIKLHNTDTAFKIIGELIEKFTEIKHTNIATLIVSIISMIFLYVIKHFINEKYKSKLPVPIPVELIVVIFGTLFSYLFHFNKRWHIQVVGPIPLGFPKARLPPLNSFLHVISGSISIAIVSFAINISMAKLFSKKYKYNLNANQELFAYGVGNIVISFFNGFPSCVGLSRSVILDSVGAKTQVFAIVGSVLVLIVILGMYIMYTRCSLLTYCIIFILSLYLNLCSIIKIISYFYIIKLNLISGIIIIGLRNNKI